MGKGKKKNKNVEESSIKSKSFERTATQTKQDEKITHVKDKSIGEDSPPMDIDEKSVEPVSDTIQDELGSKYEDKVQIATSEPTQPLDSPNISPLLKDNALPKKKPDPKTALDSLQQPSMSPLMSSWSNWFGALTTTAAATMDNLVNSLDIHNGATTPTTTTADNDGASREEVEGSKIKSLFNKLQQSKDEEDVIVKTVDRTFDFAAGAFKTGLQRLTQLTSPTTTTPAFNEDDEIQTRQREQQPKLDFDSRDWDTVFRRYGGHSALEVLL
jgi:hypothetical protein